MKSLERVAAKAKSPSASARRRRPRARRRRAGAASGARGSAKPAIEEMFRRFEAADPDPKSELEYVNPFTLLVAVVLSAQATDAGVNKATRALFKIADTPEKMVRLGEDSVRDFIKTIGLYRNKARNVIELSRQLIANHGGDVPRDRDGARGAAGRRPQDGQRRSQRCLRRADDGRRYARFSRGQPHRAVERARRRWRSRRICCASCRPSTGCTRTTG